jgi:hypothetical protein
MKHFRIQILTFAIAVGVFTSAPIHGAEGASSELDWAAESFFKTQVEPLLARACYDCHSHEAAKVKGGLYLDSKSGWMLGGNTGAVIVPGDPDASLLIQMVQSEDEDFQMPPKGSRLSKQEISVLERWIRYGAIDPRAVETAEQTEDPAESHWAFVPIEKPDLPEVKRVGWIESPLDAFVLESLESHGLQPSEPADRATLIRRAYFDLTGLPPSLESIQQFEADRSPDAFGRLVDRLLASPEYGERWARHWLDIARYADTKGYVFQEERRFPYSYTYRDYVINALNADLPYDQFIIEQLAADQLELDEPRALAGMGFLTLGRRFLNNQHDIIDDRIDVVTRGLMGVTVSCARCHDHKYDPIPSADYYSLYGVFASSAEPSERPLLAYDPGSPRYQDYAQELERITNEWNDYRISNQEGALSLARKQSGDYLQAVYDGRANNRSEFENLVKSRQLGPVIAFRWQSYLKERSSVSDPVFGPWFGMTELTDPADEGQKFIVNLVANEATAAEVNPLLAAKIRERMPATVAELAGVYGDVFTEIEEEWLAKKGGDNALADPIREELRQALYASNAPTSIPLNQATQLLEVKVQERIRALKRKVDQLPATHPGAPARAMSMVDRSNPVDPVVFLRGKPGSRGPKVPRQFLALVEGEDRVPFQQGSGRLELAKAITSPDNPLTARVIVNRIWRQHFGSALVSTPSDFGLRADPPSHPKLLDYLAARLVEDGWSLKRLHRLMMVSSTYQQSSAHDEWHAAKDPGNRWLWRMNRRRLELEPFRDTLLTVTDSLDPSMGGQPVEITEPPYTPRRTIYGFIERQNLPGLFRTFDLASPDSSSPGRFETTVPQQALFMVNSTFVQSLARNLAASIDRQKPASRNEAIDRLFEAVLQRQPDRNERLVAQQFLASESGVETEVVVDDAWRYGVGRVSETGDRLDTFTEFEHFRKGRWQGGDALPNPNLGWASLSSNGGHPGQKTEWSVVRRWVAPYQAAISLESSVRHGQEDGNGIEAWILSSRHGALGHWKIQDRGQPLELADILVEMGDTIDFVVGAKGEVSHDSFEWNIQLRAADSPLLSDQRYWNSASDFSGPQPKVEPLSPLARLGQVLLMSNELLFVD